MFRFEICPIFFFPSPIVIVPAVIITLVNIIVEQIAYRMILKKISIKDLVCVFLLSPCFNAFIILFFIEINRIFSWYLGYSYNKDFFCLMNYFHILAVIKGFFLYFFFYFIMRVITLCPFWLSTFVQKRFKH
jgi:hypothetical protein